MEKEWKWNDRVAQRRFKVSAFHFYIPLCSIDFRNSLSRHICRLRGFVRSRWLHVASIIQSQIWRTDVVSPVRESAKFLPCSSFLGCARGLLGCLRAFRVSAFSKCSHIISTPRQDAYTVSKKTSWSPCSESSKFGPSLGHPVQERKFQQPQWKARCVRCSVQLREFHKQQTTA